MMPIYWSPVHDIAAVTRATWFYKNTMYPVEANVANQLEIGYRDLRPWSQTWNDELNSAVEVGAAGEDKISHRLWPKEIDHQVAGQSLLRKHHHADRSFLRPQDALEVPLLPQVMLTLMTLMTPDEQTSEPAMPARRFLNCHVIYKDSQNAFILKPGPPTF